MKLLAQFIGKDGKGKFSCLDCRRRWAKAHAAKNQWSNKDRIRPKATLANDVVNPRRSARG